MLSGKYACCGVLYERKNSHKHSRVCMLEEGAKCRLPLIITHALTFGIFHTSPLWSVAAFSATCNFSAGVQGFDLARGLRALLVENRGTYFSPFPCVRGESWLSVPSLASTIAFLFLPRDFPFSDGILRDCVDCPTV